MRSLQPPAVPTTSTSYQSHDDDPTTPLADTPGTYQPQLIRAGKVRAIGASNFTAPRLAEALRRGRAAGPARYESLQPAVQPA